ncbi:EAL domain-containing protein [Agrobacterium sp. a22-2]|uniref:bifunctional diguanylate cyclase/phosphodiesterase n=1 Tax=Agrobacterium sp. a22-2 TaxID=2283840 RepID=UPI001446D500|nr:EAL domain-containing protein [Agrobacterium sp. a22-2]NKN35745.1 EAL domain-containing protein [Agrobacterium sp. a22-2]
MIAHEKKRFPWRALGTALQYYAPALIVILAVAMSIGYADIQKRRVHLEAMRSQVTESLGVVRAKLEGNINANIQLLQGFVATLDTEPDITQDRFSALSSRIFEAPSQLRNIAAAPKLVIKFVYPYQANKQTIGLDYRTNPAQRDAALQVQETGRYVVTGPVDLVQGGRGLIVRYPIVNETILGGRTFWGILSAVIDLDKLYRDSGLLADNPFLDIAIASRQDPDGPSTTFFGDPDTIFSDPVRMEVNFGREKWNLSAVPKGGWDVLPPDIWAFRFLMLLVAVMIMAPVLWVARLLRERQRNIAVLRQREEELRALSHRFQIALEASKIGVWELDIGSGHLEWDARMKLLYGVDQARESCGYEDWKSALHPDDLEEAERVFANAIKSGRDYSTEFRIVCGGGEIRHIRAYGTMYRDARFRKKIVGVNWNVTSDIKLQEELRAAKLQAEIQNEALEQARRHMEHNSLHDALTHLPNRRYLDQYLLDIDRQPADESPLTLLHIDLDRFKDINDTLGHGAGDQILRHAAQQLRDHIRSSDFAARIGGDEFVVVCRGIESEQQASEFARRLIDAINVPISYVGHECRVAASVGIATRQSADFAAEQLLINADIALYEAKRHGRNRVEHYTDTLKSMTINTKRTADAILRSLDQDGFVAFFQPQFDARTLEISGVEALARWRHPEQGLLAPDAFLKVAENLNVVSQIDAAILEQALLQSARWKAHDLNIPRVSVNISAQRLFDETLMNRLQEMQIVPGSLSFELLESISFDDKGEAVAAAIERIKSCGIEIEIDDFGTGYASILSLLKLSPSRLKIDRQLTMPILTSEAQRRLISSIVDIGRSLGIEIVAEGVETMEHADILRDLGCHTLQGFALARPMSAEAFITFAKDRAWLSLGKGARSMTSRSVAGA